MPPCVISLPLPFVVPTAQLWLAFAPGEEFPWCLQPEAGEAHVFGSYLEALDQLQRLTRALAPGDPSAQSRAASLFEVLDAAGLPVPAGLEAEAIPERVPLDDDFHAHVTAALPGVRVEVAEVDPDAQTALRWRTP